MKTFLTNHAAAVMAYLAVINIITFFVYGIDKRRAKKHRWRIPEITLIMFAAIGGSLGALIGMSYWHHKTRKLKFVIGVPALLLLWIIAAVCLFAF